MLSKNMIALESKFVMSSFTKLGFVKDVQEVCEVNEKLVIN